MPLIFSVEYQFDCGGAVRCNVIRMGKRPHDFHIDETTMVMVDAGYSGHKLMVRHVTKMAPQNLVKFRFC